MNDGNIRLRMTLRQLTCRVFAFTFGMNYGNIRLCMTLITNVRVFAFIVFRNELR